MDKSFNSVQVSEFRKLFELRKININETYRQQIKRTRPTYPFLISDPSAAGAETESDLIPIHARSDVRVRLQ